ncbi:MAG: hypothetical protein AAFZ18_15895 [Myxococcota bacterium]
MSGDRPFISFRWVLLSLLLFVAAEIVIGLGLGELVAGRYMSIGTSFWIRGSTQLLAFFLGGIVVGVISPGVRILEPALAAFSAVLLTVVTALFVPYAFARMGGSRLATAGFIAFGLALAGAWIGERLSGGLKD